MGRPKDKTVKEANAEAAALEETAKKTKEDAYVKAEQAILAEAYNLKNGKTNSVQQLMAYVRLHEKLAPKKADKSGGK